MWNVTDCISNNIFNKQKYPDSVLLCSLEAKLIHKVLGLALTVTVNKKNGNAKSPKRCSPGVCADTRKSYHHVGAPGRADADVISHETLCYSK